MRRDFTYIDDLITAIDRLKDVPPVQGRAAGPHDTLSPVAPFRVVNVGGGSPVGLMEFIGAVERALGTEADKKFLPMQPGDVVQTSADPTLLRSLIGETPRTSVEEGVRRFVDWYHDYRTLV
jgi:UDP-glucuronate 4-epimerase